MDNQEIWTQTTLSPYLDESGRLQRLISIDADITPLKNYEKELTLTKNRAEESDKLKSAILSNLSHEIRTPLNAIVGFTHLLTHKSNTHEQRENYQQIIQKSSFNLTRLIDDLITISKLELGEISIELKQWRLNDIIDELFTRYSLIKKNKLGSILKLKKSTGLINNKSWVNLDPDKTIQVFTNLLDNAFKYTQKGTIEFGYEISGNEIKFFVKDSGIGIPSDKLDYVFMQFNQAEIGLSRKYGGIGLGLSISKGLVLKMGGNMWVESKVGTGSSFYFTLPFSPGKSLD